MRSATETSRLARLTGPRRFEVIQTEIGEPGPGQVRVRILECGVCASELHTWEDTLDSYPLAIGHEPVGVIGSLGPGVERLSVGQAVTGGFGPSFADVVIAQVEDVVEIPEGLSADEMFAEPLGCVMEARRRTPLVAGDRVALIGAGYMGLLMLQVLMVAGAGETVVIEPRADARERALKIGANEAFAPQDVPPYDPDGYFHVVVEASGTQAGLDMATRLVRQHGVINVLGYHQGPSRVVDMQTWNWKAIDVVSGHVRRRDLLNESIRRGLELVHLGKVDPRALITHRFGLDEVNDAFEALRSKPDGFVKAVVVN
jgi:threonine dehydrogenase-like Zn-dependent dehydrogenase